MAIYKELRAIIFLNLSNHAAVFGTVRFFDVILL